MRLWVGNKHLTEETSESLRIWFERQSNEKVTQGQIQAILNEGTYDIKYEVDELDRPYNHIIIHSGGFSLYEYCKIFDEWKYVAPLMSNEDGVVYETYIPIEERKDGRLRIKQTAILNEQEITAAIEEYLHKKGYSPTNSEKWLWSWGSYPTVPKGLEVEVDEGYTE
ncbi:hypothetical protein [Siminovitchia fordii]|uniref:Uncharacterized protein n=1 Tax=Siminovitchia fordii TaxID=254759 RepID=A0ABQ4KA33_9BACI|nr:hypothetical protein [Siminovitchia fordii]GIN22585.1 hypothetical protein J1TS3_37190 [Siminovitchia fordii]